MPILLPLTLGAAVTLVIVSAPQVKSVYDNAALHLLVEATVGLVALLVALLLFGRYQRSGLTRDLLMVFALTLMGITSLFFSAIPSALEGARAEQFSSWAPLLCRTIATIVLAGAAFSRGQTPARLRSRTGAALTFGAAGLTLAAVATVVLGLHEALPRVVEVTRPLDSGRPQLEGHPAVLSIQLLSMVLYAAAATGFYRQARGDHDEMMFWFSAGMVLAAFARLNFFFYPSLYTDLFYTGDLLRLGTYGALLAGASREIASYWKGLARLAVTEERRRVAHDLHDGLAQELAFVTTQSRWLSRRTPDRESLALLSEAAERALDESRRAIGSLKRSPDEPLEAAMAQLAEEVAGRVGVEVDLDLESGPPVENQTREGLLRIVRDAMTQTARRKGAKHLTVELRRSDRIRLSIFGNGQEGGQRPERIADLDLESIGQHARSLGATLRIDSSAGRGTEVEVVLEEANGSAITEESEAIGSTMEKEKK